MHNLSWLQEKPKLNLHKLAQGLASLNGQNHESIMTDLRNGWENFQKPLGKPFKKTSL